MRFLGIEFKKVEQLNLAERIGKTAAKAVITGTEIKNKVIELKTTGKEKAAGFKANLSAAYNTTRAQHANAWHEND